VEGASQARRALFAALGERSPSRRFAGEVNAELDDSFDVHPGCNLGSRRSDMKRQTPKSLAVLAVGLGLLVAAELTNIQLRGFALGALIAMLFLSLRLMEEVPRNALFPSKHNSTARNVLNVGNFVAGIVGGAGVLYLSGSFGPPNVGSPAFWPAAIGMGLCFAIQGMFTLVPPGYGTSVR